MTDTNNQLQCGFNDLDSVRFDFEAALALDCQKCGQDIDNPARDSARWLCRVAKRGDHEAFAKLIGEYDKFIEGVITNSTHADRGTIEDYRQDVVLLIFLTAHRFDCSLNPGPWILVLTLNYIRSRGRYWRRRPRHFTASFGPPSSADGQPNRLEPSVEYEDVLVRREVLAARRRQLSRAIDGLPETLQLVARLHFAQLSNLEIAEILDISIGNVAQRLCQAKKRIKASF